MTAQSNLSDFPGAYRPGPGYSYFMPGDVFHADNLALPLATLRRLEAASLKLGEFAVLVEKLPEPVHFVRAYTHVEATLSSRIEGTQTEVVDAFRRAEDIGDERRDDWDELDAYIRALDFAIAELRTLPLCNRVLQSTHRVLLSQVRGRHKTPGEFRRSQNWIGGSRPDNAAFVPPSCEHLPDLMGRLEAFIHAPAALPHLIKAAVIHYQFETIHPFLDGNGRIGRMLIALYLLHAGVLRRPILYLSAFFEKHRAGYYAGLADACGGGDAFVRWLDFFLHGVQQTAQDGIRITQAMLAYQSDLYERQLPKLGRRAKNGVKLLDFLFANPIIRAARIKDELHLSASAVQTLLAYFAEMDIVRETTGYRRNRVFALHGYLELLQGNMADDDAGDAN